MTSLSVYCMISRNDKNTINAIKSIIKAKKNENIKILFSVKESFLVDIQDQINSKQNKFEILTYTKEYKTAFDHIKSLLDHCKSDYIIILHDDDIVGKDFLTRTYQNLIDYQPVAISSRATYINYKGSILKKYKLRSINKIYKLTSRDVLNRYFLPIKIGHNIFPTIAFETKIYKKYWEEDKFFIGAHEDVKIVYYFSLSGKFFEDGNADNFFYRIHNKQGGANKNSHDRMLLNNWVSTINENQLYKYLLLFFAKIQYLLYYKNIKYKNKKVKDFLLSIRDNLIKLRSGYY